MGNPFSKPESDDTNLETYTLIWLDAEVNSTTSNRADQEKLRTSINQLKTFVDPEKCKEHIQSLTENDRIILMTSGRLGQIIVPQVHQLRQIFSIYIYCINREKHKEWSKDYIKVQNVYTKINDLIDAILNDQKTEKCNKLDEQLSISIFKTEHFKNDFISSDSNEHFIYSQILINCLLQLEITRSEKEALYSLCENEYKLNKTELRLIHEFKNNYKPDLVISWYTKESFLYNMLIKALRNQTLDLLFVLRNIISDIQKQLNKNPYLSSVRVYRSQLISKSEFNELKNSLKQFISINAFLTAIPDRKVARRFLTRVKVSDDVERVLFEIDANGNSDQIKPFMMISSDSYDREEILFSIGSIFQINDVRVGEENIKIIQMTLCPNNHPQLQPIFNYIEKQYGNTKVSPLSYGLVLREMHKYDEAKQYYSRLLEILPVNHPNYHDCGDAIGKVFLEKETYEQNSRTMVDHINQWSKDSKLARFTAANNHINNGAEYRKKEQFGNAYTSYTKALDILKQLGNDEHPLIVRCYNNMGLIYRATDKYDEALECYEKAKYILEKQPCPNNQDLSEVNSNIGDIYQDREEYDQALVNYQQALELAEQVSDLSLTSKITLLNKIASVYEQQENYSEALVYYQKIDGIITFDKY